MIYIDGIGYVDSSSAGYNKSTTNKPNTTFDSIMEAETIVYAVPSSETNKVGSANSVGATTNVEGPAEMEAYFDEAAATYGVSKNILKAIAKAESNFDASATSYAGAMGVMQLMPSTASYLGVTKPYDAKDNIMGGAKYISSLLKQYDQDLSLALAAYNAGPGNVNKYGGIPPFTETQNYVSKVLSYLETKETTETTEAVDQSVGSSANTLYEMASQNYTATGIAHSVKAVPHYNA